MSLDRTVERTRSVESVLWLLKAKSACRRLVMITLACTGLVSYRTTAFEGDEHRKMGDLAARVALVYAKEMLSGIDEKALCALEVLVPKVPESKCPKSKSPESKSLESKSLESEIPDTSYGQIVQCVDYFLIPERIFSFAGRNPYPTGSTNVPEPDSNPLPKKLGEYCDAEGTNFIQASHFNHAHFQQDLLMSLRYGRLRAMSLARYEKNYYEALVANAIADHYLQDFFAPGHIVTPRNWLTDVLATAMHDRANEEGVRFAPSNLQVLQPILHFICGLDDKQLLDRDDCQAGKGSWLDTLMGKNKIGDISRAMKVLAKVPPESVIFRGDSYLWDTAPEQVVQRIFLLAVEVQSIIDVLRGESRSSSYDWKYEPKTGKITAKFYFGEYVLTDTAEARADSKESAVQATQTQWEPGWTTPLNVASNGEHYRLQTISPIFGISYSRESLFEGTKTARNVGSFEVGLPVFMKETGIPYIPNLVIGSAIGYSWYQDGSEFLSGPTLRLIFSVPETEFSFGPYFRRLSYATSDGDVRKNSFGIRMDFGFTGYFTLFTMLGYDYGRNQDDSLRKGSLWSVGLAASFPWSRVKNAPKQLGKLFESKSP